MPSGKVHDKLTVVTAAASVPVWWLEDPTHSVAGFVIGLTAYLFSGFWLSDDLDTNSLAYKRWGAFRWLWWPYQKLVPHRSWVSHGIGFGPLFRVAYFLVMLWAVMRVVLWGLIEMRHPGQPRCRVGRLLGPDDRLDCGPSLLGHVRRPRPRSRRRHPFRRRRGGELGETCLVNKCEHTHQFSLLSLPLSKGRR